LVPTSPIEIGEDFKIASEIRVHFSRNGSALARSFEHGFDSHRAQAVLEFMAARDTSSAADYMVVYGRERIVILLIKVLRHKPGDLMLLERCHLIWTLVPTVSADEER
jgi:hypothetical protein